MYNVLYLYYGILFSSKKEHPDTWSDMMKLENNMFPTL